MKGELWDGASHGNAKRECNKCLSSREIIPAISEEKPLAVASPSANRARWQEEQALKPFTHLPKAEE